MTNHFLKVSPNLLEDLYNWGLTSWRNIFSGIKDSLENLQNILKNRSWNYRIQIHNRINSPKLSELFMVVKNEPNCFIFYPLGAAVGFFIILSNLYSAKNQFWVMIIAPNKKWTSFMSGPVWKTHSSYRSRTWLTTW